MAARADRRDKLRRNAQPFLQPGEEIQALIEAWTFNPHLALLYMPVMYLGKPFRAIVVTDRRILVFRVGGFHPSRLSVFDEFPRNTALGPASGRVYFRTTALGRPLYIFPAFFDEIAAADAALGPAPR